MTLRPIAVLMMMTVLAGCQSVDVKPAQRRCTSPRNGEQQQARQALQNSSGGVISTTII